MMKYDMRSSVARKFLLFSLVSFILSLVCWYLSQISETGWMGFGVAVLVFSISGVGMLLCALAYIVGEKIFSSR